MAPIPSGCRTLADSGLLAGLLHTSDLGAASRSQTTAHAHAKEDVAPSNMDTGPSRGVELPRMETRRPPEGSCAGSRSAWSMSWVKEKEADDEVRDFSAYLSVANCITVSVGNNEGKADDDLHLTEIR